MNNPNELKKLKLPNDLEIKGIGIGKGLEIKYDWSRLSVEEKKKVEEIIGKHYNAWLKKHFIE